MREPIRDIERLEHKIEGMRHVLVLGYYAINFSQLMRVITNDLPVLRPQIESYINELRLQ